MPVAPPVSYPGVYIQEVPSNVRTIVPVDTATTAFVGRALRGPVDAATVINSWADFESMFGGLWEKSSMSYAVRDFFQNGGGKAVIVRVFKAGGAALTPQSLAATARSSADAFSGASGPAKDAADQVAAAAESAAQATGADVQSVAAAVSAKAAEIKAGGASGPAQDAAAAVANAVAAAVAAVAVAGKATLSLGGISLQAMSPGAWGNALKATVTDLDPRVANQIAKQNGFTNPSDLFNLTIEDTETGVVELISNVSIKPGKRSIDRVVANLSELVAVVGTLPANRPTASTTAVTASGGDDGGQLDEPTVTGSEAAKTGLYALEDANIFNLLCIPPFDGDDVSGMNDVQKSLWDEAAAYCKKRRAMLVVDPPSDWNNKAKAAKAGPSGVLTPTENAALYFPRVRMPNLLRDGQLEEFVPCGIVAGVMARTDASRGVWKAPAGIEATLSGVYSLTVPLTDAENGELNPLGVNCLRTLPAAGHVAWGARTTVGDDRLASQWKYIPVRRTALFIEETLYRNTQWAVFEPNDEPLWAQLRLNIGVFMHDLFRQGAFQGGAPKDAYFVKCDATTTTQSDIDRGIVNVIVGFAPLKPAEFVVIYIQQIAGQLAA
jgi:phage tail sheath protein FI